MKNSISMVFVALVVQVWVFGAATDQPLVQQSDLTYLGAFAIPTGTYGSSSFSYGGKGITPYTDPSSGKTTLYLEGHGYNPQCIAQIEAPSTLVKSSDWNALPKARVLQNFSDVTDGSGLSSVNDPNGNTTFIYGMLVYNNRLILGASNSYSFDQKASHAVSGLTLSSRGDFHGFYRFTGTVAPSRALGGPMTPIPVEWQTLLGGPALTGQCCISVISSTSQGPSASVFDPDQVGSADPIPGKTVLFYPTDGNVSHMLADGSTQNNVYNLTTRVGGMAFPRGSRSLLFVGGHGTGPYCYGTAAECGNDVAMSDVKGPHAQPYRYQVWAYDVNDLLAVKNGTKQTWEPRPYGVWPLDGMARSGNPNIAGGGYDPETGRWYITQDYGEQPRVEVWQITVPGAAIEVNGSSNAAENCLSASPNPFNPSTRITLHSEGFNGSTMANIGIFNVQGKCVYQISAPCSHLANGFTWDASHQPSGMYVVNALIGNKVFTGKMTLMK